MHTDFISVLLSKWTRKTWEVCVVRRWKLHEVKDIILLLLTNKVCYYSLYNDVNATRVVIGRRPWSIRVQIHRWRHAKLGLFVLFNMARFWKCLWDYFGLKQVKSSKKVQQKLFTRNKNGETGTKRALDYFRMPKLQEIVTTAAILFHRYERIAVLQNVFAIIPLWARKGVEKLFKETVYN